MANFIFYFSGATTGRRQVAQTTTEKCPFLFRDVSLQPPQHCTVVVETYNFTLPSLNCPRKVGLKHNDNA